MSYNVFMKILDGKIVASQMRAEIKLEVEKEFLSKGKQVPLLAVVLVGNDPASEIYVRNKEKACSEVNIGSKLLRFDQSVTEKQLLDEIDKLNKDTSVTGILVQLPLPSHINSRTIANAVSEKKDVDALSDSLIGKVVADTNIVAPCTPVGVLALLSHYNIDVKGKHVVVVGRSFLVGRPMELLMSRNNATTSVCHKYTKNLEKITKTADILIVATGVPKLIKASMVKKGAVVVDVGISRVDGKLQGDVDFDEVATKTSYITPVPGGVGPMTIVGLLKNTITLAKSQIK